MTKLQLLRIITDFYQQSSDFNGIPTNRLLTSQFSEKRLRSSLVTMIKEQRITVECNGNPHIKAFSAKSTEEMLASFEKADLQYSCAYPSKEYLKTVVDVRNYADRPFTLRLALGEGQLDFQAFDLRVLEFYRNDPKYIYECDDIRGHVGISDSFYLSKDTREAEKISLQTFGFGYNRKMERAIVVFLRYLHDLSPMHQQIWNGHSLSGVFNMHPDYYRNSIMGEWGIGISIFHAFVEELEAINKLTQIAGFPKLFLQSFSEARPREFAFIIRPTAKSFSAFAHLLDRMMSDNINKDFFRGLLPLESEQTRKDGKIIVQQKGTITLLKEWLTLQWPSQRETSQNEIIEPFKKVRKIRQKPAHSIEDDSFDQIFFKQQRELIIEAFRAIRLIRSVFQSHPSATDFQVPKYLSGKIWTF